MEFGQFSVAVEIVILVRAGNSFQCVASIIHYNCLNQCWNFVNSICVRKNISGIPATVDIIMVWRVGNSVSKVCLLFCKLHVLFNYLISSHLTTVLVYSHIYFWYCYNFSSSAIKLANLIFNKRLRWSRGSVLAFGTQVRGFKPGRSRRILRAKKSSARLPSEGK
jgi:hypothetical protein